MNIHPGFSPLFVPEACQLERPAFAGFPGMIVVQSQIEDQLRQLPTT
jgi:hypothetical protein